MIRYFAIVFVTLIMAGCASDSGYQKAEDAQDAGRMFIRAALDGNYKKAAFYLLKDDDNLTLIKKQQANYQHMTEEEKRSFGGADIRPVEIKQVSDTETLYTYTNTYHPKDTTTIRVLKINNEWVVDLKSVIQNVKP